MLEMASQFAHTECSTVLYFDVPSIIPTHLPINSLAVPPGTSG
jgi:hypothetical protein